MKVRVKTKVWVWWWVGVRTRVRLRVRLRVRVREVWPESMFRDLGKGRKEIKPPRGYLPNIRWIAIAIVVHNAPTIG